MLTHVVLLRVTAQPCYYVSDFYFKFCFGLYYFNVRTAHYHMRATLPPYVSEYVTKQQYSCIYIYKQLINVTLRHQLECFGISLDFFRYILFLSVWAISNYWNLVKISLRVLNVFLFILSPSIYRIF